jgi:hypothetical protein
MMRGEMISQRMRLTCLFAQTRRDVRSRFLKRGPRLLEDTEVNDIPRR